MALFHCDHCGHRELVPREYLHRTARCPECLHLSVIKNPRVRRQTSSTAQVTNAKPLPWRSWGLAAVCSLLITLQGLAIWHSFGADIPLENLKSAIVDSPDLKLRGGAEHHDRLQSPARPAVPASQPQVGPSATPMPSIFPSNDLPRVVHLSEPATEPLQSEPIAAVPVPTVRVPEIPLPLKMPAEPASDELAEGRKLFEHQWQPKDRLSGVGDGLGPVFNGRSCVECHFQGGSGGSGTNAHNVQAFEIWPGRDGEDVREGIIHAFSLKGALKESRAQAIARFGAPKIPFQPKNGGAPVMLDAVRTVFINTPALWGNGLIDKISEQDLVQLEQTHQLTGRLRRLPNGKIGKFGWKSQIASLSEFVGSACAAELGLTNSTRSQQVPQEYLDNKHAKSDMTDAQVLSLVNFVASMPAPRQVVPDTDREQQSVQSGHQLFSQVGCAQCHIQNVGSVQGVYSDFRLHLVAAGASSKEYYPENATPVYQPPKYVAQLGEWKTPPLWGVADTAPYWHDGSAPTLRDAILKHQEEAAPVVAKFQRLKGAEQEQLIDFLATLKSPELR